MLDKDLLYVTNKLRLQFFRHLFQVVKAKEGSLTAMEVFAVEVIHALGQPTISEFASFIGISRSNATYKIHSLEKKGYIQRIASPVDKREYILCLTKKYYDSIQVYESDFCRYILENEKKYPPDQILKLREALAQTAESNPDSDDMPD